MSRMLRRAHRPAVEVLDDRCLLSNLTPAQVTAAYGLSGVSFNFHGVPIKGNGAGQIIAVIDAFHDPYITSDLATFDRTYGLPNPPMGVVNLAGATTNDGWAQEEAMDVEWAHAIAPGAGIIVVEARSDNLPDLIAAVNVAKQIPLVSVVSMSWGGGEFSGQLGLDSTFTTPAGHKGITFVAASGDEGAGGGAEWPAASPNVVGVGGTTLQVGGGGSYLGESVWSGSSGGMSFYESEPAYQRAVQASGSRTAPDVSFDGDPNTGVRVYSTTPSSRRGSWLSLGGTSLGAPAWAGVVAIADEGRMLAGLSSLDGARQTLPLLYSLPSTDFHQPQSFFFGSRRHSAPSASAGRGTPNGIGLVYGLAFGSISPALRAKSVTSKTAVSPAVRAHTAAAAAPAASTAPAAPRTVRLDLAPARPAVRPQALPAGPRVRFRYDYDLSIDLLSGDLFA
jgi:hypothetical protein